MLTGVDVAVIVLYFVLMVGTGVFARRMIKGLEDYFVAGRHVPWWLAAVSHHVSGYSAFAFVGYASLAYRVGFNVWTVFALPCFLAMVLGAYLWAPRWVRLKVMTPVQYLEQRFNLLVHQVIAWSGIAVKFVDEGTKLYSLSKVIRACTGFSLNKTIIVCGAATILYLLLGGLWAELMSDFIQFVVQFSITLVLVPVVLRAVGGWSGLWNQPKSLPYTMFSSEFPLYRLIVYFVVITLSYNGGTWGLAQRFYSLGRAKEAKKAAMLSALLYLFYPLAIYIPVWAAPLVLTEVPDHEQAYILVAMKYLPLIAPGLLGLLISSMFAATMSMVDSDLNSLAAVFTKDIWQRTLRRRATEKELMAVGLLATAVFGIITVVCGLLTKRFGGAFQAMVVWYAAVLGPVAIPLLFGMLLKRTTWRGALGSWLGGFLTFVLMKYWGAEALWLHLTGNAPSEAMAWTLFTGAELAVAFAIFIVEGYLWKHTPEEQERIDALFEQLNPRAPIPAEEPEAEPEESVPSDTETAEGGEK